MPVISLLVCEGGKKGRLNGENYGLIIDAKKVNVFYQSEGSNMFPDIMVSKKSK